MKDFHDPKKTIKEDSEITFTKDDGVFHIGQCYVEKVASTLYCKNCGGNHFNVGISDYFTAVRCINCEWEICVHNG
jgi:hypothetical protein